jgi:hypothetical protein
VRVALGRKPTSPACSCRSSPSPSSPCPTTARCSSKWNTGSLRRTGTRSCAPSTRSSPPAGATARATGASIGPRGRGALRRAPRHHVLAEYVRLRSRMTVAERKLQVRVRQLHGSDVLIRVSRLIGQPGGCPQPRTLPRRTPGAEVMLRARLLSSPVTSPSWRGLGRGGNTAKRDGEASPPARGGHTRSVTGSWSRPRNSGPRA